MANRNFANGGKVWQMHSKPVLIDVQVSIGASGAVSSFTSGSAGSNSMISSIVKQGAAGTYLVTFADSYTSMLGVISGSSRVASGVSGIDHIEQLGAMAQITSGQQPQSQVTIQCVLAGVVANPTSGSVLQLIFMLNDSTAV